jgi:hypothetical protein
MSGAEKYLEAARMQMDRIEAAMHERADPSNRSVFHEIHYYFICWDAIWKRLSFLKSRSGFLSLKPLWQEYRTQCDHYVFGRDQLEHLDDWLDGRPRHSPLAAWDWGNLFGSTYTLAGRHWDVSRVSLQQLERLVHKFAEAVVIEGRRRLMVSEMNKPLRPG